MVQRPLLEAQARAGASSYAVNERRIMARVLGDIKMALDPTDYSLTPHLVMDGFWESWITCWFMANVGPEDRVLNIGANCGYYALVAARAGAKVVAVEPQPSLCGDIKISAALNGWSDRVLAVECVAGADRETRTLQMRPCYLGDAFVHAEPVPGDGRGEEWSRSTTVQEVPAHELMPSATVAFIDAEGYEPQIWQGLAPLLETRQLRWIAMEWAPYRYEAPAAFLRSLRDYGTVAAINPASQEVRVDDARLLDGTDWDTIVVRPR